MYIEYYIDAEKDENYRNIAIGHMLQSIIFSNFEKIKNISY